MSSASIPPTASISRRTPPTAPLHAEPAEIRAVIARLPVRSRAWLMAHVSTDVSIRDLARRAGVSEALARRTLVRSYGFLQTAIGQRESAT